MSHICIVGGGSALAQPVIEHYLNQGDVVKAICRTMMPDRPTVVREGSPRFEVFPGIDLVTATEDDLRPVQASGTDLLVTLTGLVQNATLTMMSLAEWNNVLHANLTTVFNALHHWLPRMANNGNVVVVGSIIGSTGGRGCANYAAAKAGLVGLVRAAANEVASRGICINLLELGFVDAGMGEQLGPELKAKILPTIPLGRFATTDDVVQAVDYLGRVRYATGTVMNLAGGLR